MGRIGDCARLCYSRAMKQPHFFKTLLVAMLFSAHAGAADITTLERELLYRAAHGSASDVSLLLERTGKPDLQNEQGIPLLSIAAARTDGAAFDIVKKLVALGANINDGGAANHYPLHAAIEAGNGEMVTFLLKNNADYRLKDREGMSAAERAKQSLSPEVSDAMNAKIAQDAAEYALLTSPAGKQKLRYDLLYHACALQYYTYYYQSGQDAVEKAEQKATLAPHQDGIKKAMAQLAQFFTYDKNMLEWEFNVGKKMIFKELEGLISNRYRREKGVGQSGDMERRCSLIAKTYSVRDFTPKEREMLLRP